MKKREEMHVACTNVSYKNIIKICDPRGGPRNKLSLGWLWFPGPYKSTYFTASQQANFYLLRRLAAAAIWAPNRVSQQPRSTRLPRNNNKLE